MFDPKTNKYPYPVDTAKHYLVVKKDDGTVFDKNYPYIDNSKKFRFGDAFVRAVLCAVVFPLSYIRMGLRINGRENLKKHRDEIKKGVISCCNHVHMWDYICIMNAVKPIRTRILSWDKNISGENGWLIRHTGGIPIPEGDLRATAAYLKAMRGYLDGGGWLHIYPEGSMWEYYRPIRPFKRGAAHLSCRFNKPIVPMAFTYREPGIIRKKLFRQIALFTLNIGEPIYPNADLPAAERENDLLIRCHDEICRLAGFKPGENIYGPIYDDSKRVDYYTDVYGIGYKGSR